MVRICIPPTGQSPLTTADFNHYRLPIPSNGLEAERDNETTLLFNNEYEAVVYADQLDEIFTTVSKRSPLKNILRDVATAIRNDDTVRNYLENSTIYVWLTNCLSSIRSVIKPAPYFRIK